MTDMDMGTVLRGEFDMNSLKAGQTYTAVSDDVSYPLLRYLVTAGYATSVWEQFLPEGRVSLTAVVGRENPDTESVEASGRMMLTQKWARDNVLRDYVNWREAWWREAIQNSVDAGATRVKLEVQEQPDGTWLVVADDDGSGMSQQQMEDPNDGFLVFGGSSKMGGIGTGAFGKAKELLVLPWIRWRVETRDKSYSGVMDAWERRSIPYRSGLRVEVVMPADFHTDKAIAMAFLEKCWIPQTSFAINGSRVTTKMPPPTDPDVLIRAHDMGNVYTYKRERNAQIYVRKNGIWMFSIDLPPIARESLLVEVTADSKRAFTQSRDAFNYHDLRSYLENLKTELSTESKILPRRDKLEQTTFYNERDLTMLASRAARIQLALGNLPPIGKGSVKFDKNAIEAVGELLAEFSREDLVGGWTLGTTNPIAGLKMCDLVRISGQKSLDFLIKQLTWFQDFRVIKYPKQPLVRKMFLPGSMTAPAYRLARVWSEMCRTILMMLGSEREYGVGFVFYDEAAALWIGDSPHDFLLINPYVNPSAREAILDPGNPAHLRQIYASALHECTHFWDGVHKHDEAYSSALTNNVAKTMIGERDVTRLSSGIKRRAPATTDPKTGGGHGPSAKRIERLRELAVALDGCAIGLRYLGTESEAAEFAKAMKLLRAKPTDAVMEGMSQENFKKGSRAADRFVLEHSRAKKTDYDDALVVMRLKSMIIRAERVGTQTKLTLTSDGSYAVRMWNDMLDMLDSTPEVDRPWNFRHADVQYGRAELTFADWDADKEKDKGEEEYAAAAQIKEIMYWLVSPLEDWSREELLPKRVLGWKETNVYLSGSPLFGEGDYLSAWEGRIRALVQLLSPTTWLEDSQVRAVANRFAITDKIEAPSFTLDFRRNVREASYDIELTCADSAAYRRWELGRIYYADYMYQFESAVMNTGLSNNPEMLDDAVTSWRVLESMIMLTHKAQFPRQVAEQEQALGVLFAFLGARNVPEDYLQATLPILAEHGMVGTPTGDEIIVDTRDGNQSFVFTLAPASEDNALRWKNLRRVYDLFHPRAKLIRLAGIEIEGAVEMAASIVG